VLDFSKIEAGKLELDCHDFDLRTSVEATGVTLAAQAEVKGLELKVDVHEDVPPVVTGDRGRLRQVLTNLVSNAVKFTQAGEVRVVVGAGPVENEQVELHFSVTDTGIGIAESEIDRLFESFAQADSSTTRRYGGTGLGLAISRRLVEFMGGSISAVSRPGAGSTFSFTVCLGVPPPSSHPRPSRRRRRAPPARPPRLRSRSSSSRTTRSTSF
jgi:signal transduction histidine kinase